MSYMLNYGVDGLREYAQNLAEKGGIEIKYTDKHRLYRAIELMTAGDYESLIKQTKVVYPIKAQLLDYNVSAVICMTASIAVWRLCLNRD